MLYAAERIREILLDPVTTGTDIVAQGEEKSLEGIGVIEAPRGTLIHHYLVNDSGTIEKANLIVSTTNNNQAILWLQ